MLYGAEQGSILGLLLLNLYVLPLCSLISKHTISYNYADNIQLCLSLCPDNITTLNLLFTCLKDIKLWMSQNFLQLNKDKTGIIVFDPRHRGCLFKSKST